MIIGMDSTRGVSIPSLFEGDGLENNDWFGWEEPVLAPCNGSVISTDTNERTPPAAAGGAAAPTPTTRRTRHECLDGQWSRRSTGAPG